MNRKIDLVKKSYEELQDEVLKLITDKFLLQNRWNSLKEWLEDYPDEEIARIILDKMNELEGVI